MNKLIGFLYKAFFTIIINFTVIGVISGALDFNLNLNIITIVIISTILFLLIFLFFDKKPIFLIVLIAVLFVLALIYSNFYNELFNSFFGNINTFFMWINSYVNNKDINFNQTYFNNFLIMLTSIISLFIYITIFKFKRVYPVLLTITAFFLYRWFWYQNSAFNYYYLFIFAVFSLYIFNKYISKFTNWKKADKDNSEYKSKYLIVYSLIVSITIILIAFILPKDNPPIKWRWMDNKVQSQFPQVTEWRNDLKKSKTYGEDLEFDLTFTPYQNQERKLGGNIEIDNILVMEVDSKRPLYLKGIVKDEYTGSYWESSEDETVEYSSGQTIDVRDENTQIDSIIEYEVNYINLTTSTIFTSYNPIKINYEEEFYISDEYEAYTNKVILENKGYSIETGIPRLNREMVDRNHVKDFKYTELPNSVTDRTRELAEDITRSSKNDYDKMIELQNYLRENYSYSLTPGDEDYEDFVDNFIFEKNEGYCTYFASSLAVMGRTLDIPTRYVEGFITGDKNDEGKYDVYSENAHAWVEAYINGYGWMVFEATPEYTTPENALTSEEEIEEESEEDIDNQNTDAKEDELQEMLEGEESIEDDLAQDLNEDRSVFDQNLVFIIVAGIIILILATLIALYLYYIINQKINYKRLKEYDSKEKMRFYYREFTNIINNLGYDKELGETDMEFTKRINIGENLDSGITYFIDTYIKVIYGKGTLKTREEKKIQKIIEDLYEELKSNKGTLKYIVQKVYNIKGI